MVAQCLLFYIRWLGEYNAKFEANYQGKRHKLASNWSYLHQLWALSSTLALLPSANHLDSKETLLDTSEKIHKANNI